MPKFKDDVEKNEKEWNFRQGLLEAVLVSSTNERNYKLPTIKEFILSELVNGTLDYIGTNAGEVIYSEHRSSTFEHKLFDYFTSKIKGFERKLDRSIRNAITQLATPRRIYPGGPREITGGPYVTTILYDHYDGIVPIGIAQSVFSLPQGVLIKIQNKVLPCFTDGEGENVRGIGKSMRKYIDKDLEFINKTYHW